MRESGATPLRLLADPVRADAEQARQRLLAQSAGLAERLDPLPETGGEVEDGRPMNPNPGRHPLLLPAVR